jgi:ferritin-like protein
MPAGSAGLHEPVEMLEEETVERHRALVSLIEELEAVDWYSQRVDACSDEGLRQVLGHNRDEEKEHACMTLEWLRRHDETWDALLRRYLFRAGPIVAEGEEAAGALGGGGDGSLSIGGRAAGASR